MMACTIWIQFWVLFLFFPLPYLKMCIISGTLSNTLWPSCNPSPRAAMLLWATPQHSSRVYYPLIHLRNFRKLRKPVSRWRRSIHNPKQLRLRWPTRDSFGGWESRRPRWYSARGVVTAPFSVCSTGAGARMLCMRWMFNHFGDGWKKTSQGASGERKKNIQKKTPPKPLNPDSGFTSETKCQRPDLNVRVPSDVLHAQTAC